MNFLIFKNDFILKVKVIFAGPYKILRWLNFFIRIEYSSSRSIGVRQREAVFIFWVSSQFYRRESRNNMIRLALLIAQLSISVFCSKCYSCMPRKGDEIENLRYYYPVGNNSHIIGSTAADGNYFGFAFNRSCESRRQIFEFRKSCVFPTNETIRNDPKQPPGTGSKL